MFLPFAIVSDNYTPPGAAVNFRETAIYSKKWFFNGVDFRTF